MKLSIALQVSYSRLELILRTLFGALYIALPHAFILFFLSIWGGVLSFIAFWMILFSGRYPEHIFEYQVQLIRWRIRVYARIYNLADDYPAFGLSAIDERVTFEVPYPEKVSRLLLLIRIFFGVIYVILPHAFILFFRVIWGSVLSILAWFSVLFTKKFPESWHEFLVGTLRWETRVGLYMSFMTDTYPPFSAK
tara:strand:+ start:6913 stop:7494 length:582 start_codon:yes stop_codon:yes gene_type:complete